MQNSQMAGDPKSHRLLFDNGAEIDLTKANLIAGARPKPIQTPRVTNNSRNNFNSKSLGPLAHRTPMPGIRSKAEFADGADDPLQRMVNLQKRFGEGSSRFRQRNASAQIESQLQARIQRDMGGILGREDKVTSQVMESEQFQNNWQTSKQSVISLQGVLQGTHSRSMTRQQLQKLAINQASDQSLALPPLINNGARGFGSELKRIQPGKPADQLLTNLAHSIDDEDSKYFEKSSIGGGGPGTAADPYRGVYSTVSNNIDQQSSYHMDLLEEKREEIQNIIRKRQRKAAFNNIMKQNGEGQGKATMINYAGRGNSHTNLPDITPQRKRPQIEIQQPEENSHAAVAHHTTDKLLGETNAKKLQKYNQGDSDSEISLADRFPGALADPNDEQQKRIDQLEREIEETANNKVKVTMKTLNHKETRAPGQPDLLTGKRANRQVNQKSPGLHSPPPMMVAERDKHQEQVIRVQKKLIAQHQQLQNGSGQFSPRPKPIKIPKARHNVRDVIREEREDRMGSPTVEKALATVLAKGKLNQEFSQMTEVYIHKNYNTHTEPASPALVKDAKNSPQRGSMSKKSVSGPQSIRGGGGDRESRVSTPETSTLSGGYKKMEGLIDKQTALRIQKLVKKSKAEEESVRLDFLRKQEELLAEQDAIIEEKSESNSTAVYQKQKRDEFNSELDLYSEIASVSPGRRNTLGRRGTIAVRKQLAPQKPMRVIPAEVSDNEKSSLGSGLDSNDDDGDGEEREDDEEDAYESSDDEDLNRASAMNERKEHKKNIIASEAVKKEEQELIGHRLTRKIDDFIFQVSVEAGLADTTFDRNNGNVLNDVMLQTGNTSLFQADKIKNDDQGVFQKVMDKYETEFRGEQAFYQLIKNSKESKYTDPDLNNPRMQYYNECIKENSVAKPILSRIIDKQLVLRDIKLNSGDAKGLNDTLMYHPDLINKLYLDNNGLDGNQLALICEGINYQREMHNLTIQGSFINEKTVEQLCPLLRRKIPDNLQELHLIHAKCVWSATETLLKSMRQRNYLRKLSLIDTGLNDFSLVHLCEIVRTQKSLVSLDISWNHLMPVQMRPLLEILQKNRRLSSLSLAWNNIMEVAKSDDPSFIRQNNEIIQMLGKIIKHSKTLQHIDLTGTGLSSQVIHSMGTALRRSRSILVIHLSGNPGLNLTNMEYLTQRIRCRPNEDIERYTRITTVVKNTLKEVGGQSNIMSGIKGKVDRDFDFHQVHKKDPIEFSISDQLVFQRMLGHKMEHPGSGQWYESSKNAVACHSHYKNECWICDGHVYSVIFWSKAMCYKLNPILNKDKTEVIRYVIDQDFGEQEANDLVYTNASVKYSLLENQVPYICGSFTGWRYRKMLNLEEFNRSFEKDFEDAFDIAYSNGSIRKRVTNREMCNDYELRHVEIAELEQKLKYTYSWRKYFSKHLKYKRPFNLNSHLYNEQPSPDGTVPEDETRMAMGEVLSDTSEEVDSEQEEVKEEVKEEKVKISSMSPSEQQAHRAMLEERKKNPIPPLPDVNKFDKIFILPIFLKPGKHQYMIKYKDTSEARQAHLLKKIKKQEKRYRRGKSDKPVSKEFNKEKYRQAKAAIAPECFMYNCEVSRRTEEIPQFSKVMANKVIERAFDKEASVFGKWRQDTASSLNSAFAEDIKLWKGYRFIKSDDDKADTEAVLKKYFLPLKNIFIHLGATSSWPNIGSLDFCDFATKAKFLDSTVNISTIDRAFIAANLKVESATAPSNGLKRFEYLEILVRLGNIKFLETRIVKTYAQATEKLITECVLAHFHPEPWQEFRDEQLWTIDVNDILKANINTLQKIYDQYRTPTKPLPELEDFINMCTRDATLNISEKDINFCFGLCQMTVLNEERQWKSYQSLQFVEFLEFIGRMAHQRFKHSSPEMMAQPLASKIELILDDLCQGFGMMRQDVNIEVEEFSESDDDY